MTARPDLESRLRTGLRAAGEALPPAVPDRPAGRSGHRSSRRRGRAYVAAAGAAAVVAVVAGVGVVVLGGDDEPGAPDVEASQPEADPSTTSTTDAGPGVDPAAGSAVVIGSDLVNFGPDGQPGDTLPLAPLTQVQSVVSDRHGGWIACGTPPETPPLAPPPADGTATITTITVPVGTWTTDVDVDSQAVARARELAEAAAEEASGRGAPSATGPVDEPTAPQSNAYRYRPGEAPAPLSVSVLCVADSLGVTEVGGADVLVYVSPATFSLQRLDLATGAATALSIDMASLPGSASVGGGRLATFGDDGLALWDLATGDPVAVGPVDLPVRAADATSGLFTGNLVLSPDGTTLAALVGDGSGTSDVVVVDLASGGEIFRRTVSTSMEGANLSYDGTTVAVGNFYDSYGPVQIFDLATGAQRTVDAHGILP
jgi:hypothetical protein